MGTSVVWIRNDLRFHDNTALIKAINHTKDDEQLIITFYLDPKQFKARTNSHDYFFSSLNSFYKSCLKKGLDIYFMYGELLYCFDKLLKEFGNIERIYFNIDESGYGQIRDQEVSSFLKERNVEVLAYYDHCIHSAKDILKSDNSHYKVFTPYYNNWREEFKSRELDINYDKLMKITLNNFTDKDKQGREKFCELIDDVKRDFSEFVGEERARKILKDFVNFKLSKYDKNRDLPYTDGTSRLSYFLSTGQISIREVYNTIVKMPYSKGKETFIKELAWRDFYNMIYHFYPNQYNEEIIPKYRNILWEYGEEDFIKWKEGKTGFPIVDAAMRQLKEEGWMHNRLRMISASFLVKDLLIDWRWGEKYFSEMLIDYDSASNIGGWQWVASVGTDAVPYFRIFNPTTQSQKFDPEGKFIKKYVKELNEIPKEYIHEPYRHIKQLKNQYGIDIEKLYSKPMVDHKIQRLRAIEMFNI